MSKTAYVRSFVTAFVHNVAQGRVVEIAKLHGFSSPLSDLLHVLLEEVEDCRGYADCLTAKSNVKFPDLLVETLKHFRTPTGAVECEK